MPRRPLAAIGRSALRIESVKIALERPWLESFCRATASSKLDTVKTYRIGAKVSSRVIGGCAPAGTRITVGST